MAKVRSAKEAAERIDRLFGRIAEAWYEIAQLLHDVHQYELYAVDYPSFKAWVDAELPFSYRKALYLVATLQRLQDMGVSEKSMRRVLPLGWNKASRVAARASCLEELEALVDLAGESSRRDLEETLRGKRQLQITVDADVASRTEALLEFAAKKLDVLGDVGWRGTEPPIQVEAWCAVEEQIKQPSFCNSV